MRTRIKGAVLAPGQDAFGQALMACLRGQDVREIVERDDRYIDASGCARLYFAPYREWDRAEKQVMRFVRGRVLDIGCGAGRHCLHLQRKGYDVTGIDNSPQAVRVCRKRGVRRVVGYSIADLVRPEVRQRLGRFDTILMMASNFGLFGGLSRARRLLRSFLSLTSPGARIIASTSDPYRTNRPEHTAYHARNRRLGRMGGQVRIRVRYRKSATPWFDYLLVSRPELKRILAGTGWQVERFVRVRSSPYFAVIRRD
jgi:2-polyprenyl-3-methyl-5-hydroxy-6-metoxy-1,4-benzoquinol methylase